VRNNTLLFVLPAIFYVFATLVGFCLWVYSALRTNLSFAWIYSFSWALGLLLFSVHLIFTLYPPIMFWVLGPHGPQLWVCVYTAGQVVNFGISLVGLTMLLRWIHRQVSARTA
jgi:hypothetical protein